MQKFDCLQNEKSFLDKIKNIFIIFISSGKDVLIAGTGFTLTYLFVEKGSLIEEMFTLSCLIIVGLL